MFSPEAKRLLTIAGGGMAWAFVSAVPPVLLPAVWKISDFLIAWGDAE